MGDKHQLTPSIIEISNKNDVTKEITMLVHKIDAVNGNGLDFKKEYVESFMNSLVDKPVVAKYVPFKDDLTDHEAVLDADGKITALNTIAIGTITDVWIADFEQDEEVISEALYAKATLWNYKYPQIVSCVESLYEENNSDSSVEVEIYSYNEGATQEYRYGLDFEYLGNCLLGSSVLPADDDAGVISIAQKEIAAAVQEDLKAINTKESKEGDVEMPETNKIEFNQGKEIKFHGKLEASALLLKDVSNQIYNKLNPIDAKSGDRDYNYWISDVYTDHVIVEDWDDYKTLYSVDYTIENDEVILSDKETWIKGYKGFIPSEVVEVSQALTAKEKELSDLNEKLTQEKEVSTQMEEKVQELEAKVTELNDLLVAQKEGSSTLEEKITELNSQIEELTPYKENFEKAEQEKKQTELSSKYSKLISKEVFASERVTKAIQELNSSELNNIVVEEIAKEKELEVEVNSKEKEVEVSASKQEDLIEQDKEDFWASPRS